MATGIIMADVAGTALQAEDKEFLSCPEIGGIILFARNVESAKQVRQLTDAIRNINPNILIAVDQEGGRVARFRQGFSSLPAMGQLGKLYDNNPKAALLLSYDAGYLMACEVLAVGVDFSFAPVLDVDGVSLVIGDRAFHSKPDVIIELSSAFIKGMKDAGMASTGKHFPGHGSIAPDSHIADAVDTRSFDEIFALDLQPFVQMMDSLDALMPAHVIFSKVDDKPAGFSPVWIQEILRQRFGFDGVIFSDDLCMKAAHTAGDVDARVIAAIQAGCDMALVCNNRQGALMAIKAAKTLKTPIRQRFTRMQGSIPVWQGSLEETCRQFSHWEQAKNNIQSAFFTHQATKQGDDPTQY